MIASNDRSIRIGVVGCGVIADLYHLPALAAHPRVRMALAEPHAERLAALAAKYGAFCAVRDYRELAGEVDGVIVATPPALHYPIAKWFLERGIHVLCEKPLTEALAEARELVDVAQASGAQLAVNQTRRLFPTYQKIRQLIGEGVLGPLTSITYHDGVVFNWPAATAQHFAPGAKGTWSDTGVHLLDTICYWLDAQPELVESLNDAFGGPEAMATVRLQHEKCRIEIKVSRLGRLMNGFRITGEKGSIQADAETFDAVTVRFRNGRRRTYHCGSNRAKYTDFAKPLIDNFVQVVEGKADPLISGASTLGTIELLESAYQQARHYAMPWNAHWERDERQPERMPRVLVTGASGFLGGRIVEAMQLQGSRTPVAALRRWPRAARVARYPVEMTLCDILDERQVDQAVAGVDQIIHCAKTDDRESIVGGTRKLLEAAERHGIQRLVFISTAEVYGPEQSGVVTEACATPRTGQVYGDSKIEAEEVCQEFAARGVATTILRPSIIYGPFSGSWSVDMATRLLSGKWGVFDEYGEGIANLVYVDDLVQAIFLALDRPEAAGKVYNVNGPQRLTWNQYFERFNEALELPPLKSVSSAKSRVRTFCMDQVGRCTALAKSHFQDKLMEIYLRGGWASKWMKRLKGSLKSTPSGGELTGLFSRRAQYDDAKIRQQLGYAPQFDLQRGLALTVKWLRLQEVVPHKKRWVDLSQGFTPPCERETAQPVVAGSCQEEPA